MLGNPVNIADVEEAARSFYTDFKKVRSLHSRLIPLLSYSGREWDYDGSLRDVLARQEELMFGLRNLYVDAYDLLSPRRRSEVFKWIVTATGELQSSKGQLGLAPILVIAGVIMTAATATALVAWHRLIGVQSKAISYQESLIPFVVSGDLPSDVLVPDIPGNGLSGLMGVLPFLLVGALSLYGISVFKGRS